MSAREIIVISFRTLAIYLGIVNIFIIIDKVLFPVYISNYLITPNLLMLMVALIIWLICKRAIFTESGFQKTYIEYLISGLMVIANGAYTLFNLIWIGIFSYVDRPQVMIGNSEMLGSEGTIIVLKLILPHLVIYLAEVAIGLVVFLKVKKILYKERRAVENASSE